MLEKLIDDLRRCMLQGSVRFTRQVTSLQAVQRKLMRNKTQFNREMKRLTLSGWLKTPTLGDVLVRVHGTRVELRNGEAVGVREGADLVGPPAGEHRRARGYALRRRRVRAHKIDAGLCEAVEGGRRRACAHGRRRVDDSPVHRVAHEEEDVGLRRFEARHQ